MICAPNSYNLPSFTTSKTDNLLFLGSFQNTSEHILKPPALCRLSSLCVFDQNTNKRCNSFHICICVCNSASTQTFCTDISCLPFGQGRPFFYIVSANSALFAKKNGCKLSDKRPKKFFGNAWCREQSRGPPCNNSI